SDPNSHRILVLGLVDGRRCAGPLGPQPALEAIIQRMTDIDVVLRRWDRTIGIGDVRIEMGWGESRVEPVRRARVLAQTEGRAIGGEDGPVAEARDEDIGQRHGYLEIAGYVAGTCRHQANDGVVEREDLVQSWVGRLVLAGLDVGRLWPGGDGRRG